MEDLIKQFKTQPNLSKQKVQDEEKEVHYDKVAEVDFEKWQTDFSEQYCQIKAGASEEEIFTILEKAEDDFNRKRRRTEKQAHSQVF